MNRAALCRSGLVVLALGLIVLAGCNDETTSGLTGAGTIGVYPLGSSTPFPWQLVGPDGYQHEGSGDEVLEDMAVGSYTITWQGVTGWVTPSPAEVTKNVTAGALTTFTATYRATGGEILPGQIDIDPLPNNQGFGFPWSITGPDEFSASGTGFIRYENMDPGDYTVTWGDVDDWTTPSPAVVTLTLEQGAGLRFTATWVSEEGSSITFKPILPGTFLMGSPRGETGSSSYEWPQHRVTLTRPFEMSETEITWEQYVNLMGNNPSYYDDVCLNCPGDYPMESVSWLQAVQFCNALSLAEGYAPAYTVAGATVTWDQDADGYRLPTEAEWEYACRAGTITALSNGDLTSAAASCYSDPNLELIAWYCNNSSSRVHPAGDKQPNEWGLRDMHGNVWEWVWDFSRNYESISLQLGDFTFLDGSIQQRGTITVMEAETGFGTEKIFRLDQIGATFGVSNLGVTSSQVSFHYADFDSVTNFRVNGQTLYRGMFSELPGTVAPGVTVAVTSEPVFNGTYGDGVAGTVTLTGAVTSVLVGGKVLMIDDFSVVEAGGSQFARDRLADLDLFVRGQVYRPNPGGIPTLLSLDCTISDPIGRSTGSTHALRGGSFYSNPGDCRSAARSLPNLASRYAGFRVARFTD